MLGWSLICIFAIACLLIIAMLVALPIVFLVGGVGNLMGQGENPVYYA